MFCLDVIVNLDSSREFKYKKETYLNDKNFLEFLNIEGKFGWEYVHKEYTSGGEFVVIYKREILR